MFLIASHKPFRWARANSSALSGRCPRTFVVEFGDLNGKAGRHMLMRRPALTLL